MYIEGERILGFDYCRRGGEPEIRGCDYCGRAECFIQPKEKKKGAQLFLK